MVSSLFEGLYGQLCCLVTLLYWTPITERCMEKIVIKNVHHKGMCHNEIGPCS